MSDKATKALLESLRNLLSERASDLDKAFPSGDNHLTAARYRHWVDHIDTALEVPDAPASWPIIDGVPKNPAAFEALYRACQWIKTLEEWEYAHPDLEFVSSSIEDALIEVWPEFRTIGGPLKFCDAMNRVSRKRDEALALADKGVGQ